MTRDIEGNHNRLEAVFSTETREARLQWDTHIAEWKTKMKNVSARILEGTKVSGSSYTNFRKMIYFNTKSITRCKKKHFTTR